MNNIDNELIMLFIASLKQNGIVYDIITKIVNTYFNSVTGAIKGINFGSHNPVFGIDGRSCVTILLKT